MFSSRTVRACLLGLSLVGTVSWGTGASAQCTFARGDINNSGVIDLNDAEIETPQKVANRIRAGLKHLPPDKLLPAPDCGMKYLPRGTAFGKLKALAEGAAIVRKEL